MQSWPKRSSIAIDFRSAGNHLVSCMHDRKTFFKSFAGAGRLNLHESNSGNLKREIGQAITAMQSPAQLSPKRRMEGDSTPSVRRISTIRKTSRKVLVFASVILRVELFWRNKRTNFPQGLFPEYPFFSEANKRIFGDLEMLFRAATWTSENKDCAN